MNSENQTGRSGLSDEKLAQLLQGGDEPAFDELVRRHQGRVYAVAYRLTSNREDALDVSQEAFLKAYRKIGRWQPKGPFLPWLLRLTINQAIDLLRREKRQRRRSLEDRLEPEEPGRGAQQPFGAAERLVAAREIDGRVQAAMRVLSPAQRAVFVMRHYEGLPLADIAAVLGCTTGSVKVHLFRALKKLQRELRDLYQTRFGMEERGT
jgi:RNA polymerase sigma-70 factor (ECF subfamily)